MIRIRQIKIPVSQSNPQAHLEKKILKCLRITAKELISWQIKKEAIDARNKNNIFWVYEVDVKVKDEAKITLSRDILLEEAKTYQVPKKGEIKLTEPIYIVGSGPAGLFAAYLLTSLNYPVVVFERGEAIANRIKDVEIFWQTGKLNPESNVQFGEGGAGTFSDGKLNTSVKDRRNLIQKVLEILVENGAPKEILYQHQPHIGTDNLRQVVVNMRHKIMAQGGKFYFNSKLTDIITQDNKLEAIEINNIEKIPCHNLILTIGHSARDTIRMLQQHDLTMEPKGFAVGIRIMHDQAMINESQYGKWASILPNASYKLTHTTTKGRGVYSFCMCPGGFVINAASETNGLAINGMSNYRRDSGIANSAIVVTVKPEDFGNTIAGALSFQQNLEQTAYELGQGKIPLQLWRDYQNNVASTKLGQVRPM